MNSWRSLLLRIGDKSAEYSGSSDVEEHIETCYSVMWKELDYSEDDILSFLMQCVEQLPHKMPMYGTLVGLLNLENEEIVKKVLENLQKELQAAVDSGDCNKIRILLRFVTVLMCNSVLQSGAVVELYEALLSFAATSINDEAGNPAWQARADFYVTCVLSCLPWGGAELIEQAPDEFGRVLALIETYFNIRRHCYDAGFSVFSPKDVNNTNPDEKDFLEDLWDRIQSMQSNGWKVDSVPRPHLLFESRLVAGRSHEFGPINCPEQPDFPMSQSEIESSRQMHEAQMKCPCRLRRIHIFPKSKAEENMQPIDRFVVEEYLLDVLLFFNGCRKECASYMVGLPVPFRYEYLMAETLFSQLLLLPEPPFKPIYYTLVIIDLCKALPGAFPAVVAAAVRVLFERIADMDMECRYRLILWFSHHLSNFQFIWPWEDWSYVLDLPNWAPQRVFVQEVLERETRLSYREKIKQSVENVSVLEELLPPVSGPCFKYSGEDSADTPEHGLSSELKAMVRGKKTSRDIISWLEGKIMPEHGPKLALEVVSQTFLDIGAKSFTHLITVLERYGQVIARLCPDQDNQVTLIEEISMFWKNSSQLTSITIDRMMGYRLISNLAIVRWVFSPANVRQFHVSDRPWEVLRNALDKTCNRISDLRKEIKLLESGIISVKEATSKAQAELEFAETRLVIRDGEPVVAEAPARLKRLKSYVDKAKEEEVSAHESLEAKQALLSRAHVESETLFIAMYKNLSDILVKGFPSLLGDKHGYPLELQHDESMVVDSEEPKRDLNLNGVSSGYDVKETDQWRLCVLGYVNAFSRKYASEIWVHIQKLDEEVLAKDPSSQLLKAVYSGLCRPLSV